MKDLSIYNFFGYLLQCSNPEYEYHLIRRQNIDREGPTVCKKKQNTTLNNLVREYLRKITGRIDIDNAADEFENIALEHGGKSPKEYKFNREELYERTK